MSGLYERNIAEIKIEYTSFLVSILTPLIYEGIKSLYNYSVEADKKIKERKDGDTKYESVGVMKIFTVMLKQVPALSNTEIEKEYERIKRDSKCYDWFDDLVRSVVKSNIILLTCGGKTLEGNYQKYHEEIDVKNFIHNCYIECARVIYNNPELFYNEGSPMELKRNQREALELIKSSITEAIRRRLPMKMILIEYLQNDYVADDNKAMFPDAGKARYENVKAMIQKEKEIEALPIIEKEERLAKVSDIGHDLSEKSAESEKLEPINDKTDTSVEHVNLGLNNPNKLDGGVHTVKSEAKHIPVEITPSKQKIEDILRQKAFNSKPNTSDGIRMLNLSKNRATDISDRSNFMAKLRKV